MGKTFLPSTARPAFPWEARRAGDDYGAPAKPDWREIDWRPHIHQIEVDKRKVNYVDYGEDSGGPPIVFVHGLGGSWHNWLENIPRAGTERRVLAIDLPGHGLSDMPRKDITITLFAQTVESVCEQLGLGPVVVVGNSMGGFTGAEMAIQMPQRVDRLVLVAAAGLSITKLHRAPTLTLMRAAAMIGTYIGTRSEAIASRPRARHLVLNFIVRHPSRIPADFAYELIHGSSGTGLDGFIPSMEALLSYDFRDRLPEIECPTLIVHGTDDMLVPVRDADEFARLIPHSRKIIMEDTGHTPMIERPQTFNDCLMDFLAGSGEARSSGEREAA